eukprot:TRINITY_DN5415_c0_g1_i1.p2 TRINITY_DN5415_c0_g1~~TRINITY_DN5415_c0_g1_i1.p2  ORF type:complete len:65 (+),score=19.06 TRINITY_DN5415_c0_g1_i1:193-387(+)
MEELGDDEEDVDKEGGESKQDVDENYDMEMEVEVKRKNQKWIETKNRKYISHPSEDKFFFSLRH